MNDPHYSEQQTIRYITTIIVIGLVIIMLLFTHCQESGYAAYGPTYDPFYNPEVNKQRADDNHAPKEQPQTEKPN